VDIALAATLFYVLAGCATGALFGWDKWQARRGGRRVPEARLHAFALAGGFLGAWLGMLAFRHKTRKPAFRVVPIAAAVLHAGAWAWWLTR
jgi:uncharacterized membrane protein YsdA (DUF1294 family)